MTIIKIIVIATYFALVLISFLPVSLFDWIRDQAREIRRFAQSERRVRR